MNEYAAATAKRRLPRKLHVIDAISYSQDRLVCACGEAMSTLGGAFALHRAAVGAPRLNSGILGPARGASALRVRP
jgi:hypothetical protein